MNKPRAYICRDGGAYNLKVYAPNEYAERIATYYDLDSVETATFLGNILGCTIIKTTSYPNGKDGVNPSDIRRNK